MFYFVFSVVIVSILVSLFATWIKLIPRYQSRKHVLIQQLTNTVILSILLTVISLFGIYPSWFLLFVMILFVLWLSVRITNNMVEKGQDSAAENSRKEQE